MSFEFIFVMPSYLSVANDSRNSLVLFAVSLGHSHAAHGFGPGESGHIACRRHETAFAGVIAVELTVYVENKQVAHYYGGYHIGLHTTEIVVGLGIGAGQFGKDFVVFGSLAEHLDR